MAIKYSSAKFVGTAHVGARAHAPDGLADAVIRARRLEMGASGTVVTVEYDAEPDLQLDKEIAKLATRDPVHWSYWLHKGIRDLSFDTPDTGTAETLIASLDGQVVLGRTLRAFLEPIAD